MMRLAISVSDGMSDSINVYTSQRAEIRSPWLGEGLVYEAVDDSNVFPHFYGPSRSFSPLPLDVVTKAEKLTLSDGQFRCSLLS
ncbi:hypothetical protein Acr_13g0000290 [Actinidia rufa]|uniref:Uncharacterized protein n=1 Tax=Actinidia rufa TaxID=165716 RepID=A0A7J0FIV2_9ERIC|nr:hypothetical protein Acr_13g0000290 [Actinidia rufa]